MGINLSGSPSRPSEPRQDYTLPSGRARSGALASGRPCPFLGSEDGPGLANNSPSRTNVCHAHPRKEWKGMIRVTIPYSRLTREKQAEVCFAAFNQCPYHAQGAKMMEEHKQQLHEEAQQRTNGEAPKPKKRRASHRSQAPMSNRKRTALQFAGLGVGAMVCAFVVSLVVSAEPGRMLQCRRTCRSASRQRRCSFSQRRLLSMASSCSGTLAPPTCSVARPARNSSFTSGT